MKNKEQLKREIMGRVYIGYTLRQVWSFAMLRFAVIAGALVGIVSSVSIRHVLQNMPSPTDLNASYDFFNYAFYNTEVYVQLSIIAIVATGLITFAQLTRERFARNIFA